ncbi:MAG: peptidoglycan-associated lipoprotein Pal [Burkholderiales bacterium]
MKTSLAVLTAAVLAGCAAQATQESEPAPAPAPTASSPSAPQARASTSGAPRVAATPGRSSPMPGARSVYYEYDKSDIKPDGAKTVEAHAQYLRDHPDLKVKVEGNADERGSAEYNLALGQRRAEAVSKRMTVLGISSERIESVSFGKEKPKASGHDEQSWSENRRSDIVYR